MARITSSVSLNRAIPAHEPDGFFDPASAGPAPGSGDGAFADPLAQVFPNTRLPRNDDAAGAAARQAPKPADTPAHGLGATLSRIGFTTEDERPRFSPGTSFGPCKFKLRVHGMTLQHPLPDEVKLQAKCKF